MVHMDQSSGMDAADVIRELRDGEPSIAAMTGRTPEVVRFDVRLCEEWEIEAIGARLRKIMGG